jgi:hypothetical protein
MHRLIRRVKETCRERGIRVSILEAMHRLMQEPRFFSAPDLPSSVGMWRCGDVEMWRSGVCGGPGGGESHACTGMGHDLTIYACSQNRGGGVGISHHRADKSRKYRGVRENSLREPATGWREY